MVWMDVYEVEKAPLKGAVEEIARPPLVPSEKNNAVSRKLKTPREIPSRYKSAITSPSMSSPGVGRRCPSPNITRTVRSPSPSFPKRAQSADRRRPSTPSSPSRPSTPVHNSSVDMQSASRRLVGGRTPEGLWPSTTTMRSLSVSFQSDTFSLPVSKKEKPVNDTSFDNTLKPSTNVGRRLVETPAGRQKVTPERKRTPLRGRNVSDQTENAKPVDNSHHRWPSRTGGKMLGRALTRSMDLTDMSSKATMTTPIPGRGTSPMRRMPIYDVMGSGMRKSISEVGNQVSSDDFGRVKYEIHSTEDTSLRLSGSRDPVSSSVGILSSPPERAYSSVYFRRSQSVPTPGLTHPPSPSKGLMMSSISSRGLSPSRTRSLTPFHSVSTMPGRSSSSSSVLSFIADVRKGKKGANHIEDVHQLRLLYNRYLQLRFANARADGTLYIQKVKAEKTLYTVGTSTSELLDTVRMKRINLQQLKQELKLISVLNEQMAYLDDWYLLERDHSSSLFGAVEALEACTLRLPVTGGARAEVQTVSDAICSAVDVIEATNSFICSLLSRVEETSHLISELAAVTAQESAVLHECEDFLASTLALQVKENSLRTHLIQLKQALKKG